MAKRAYLKSRWYWLLVAVAMVFSMLVGVALFVSLGWNPYIGASVASGVYTLYETYSVAVHVDRPGHPDGGES